MSNTLIPVITQVGLQAVFNASNSGLQAEITEIALGDQGWQPDNAATGLRNERRRIQISKGERIAPTQIHITAVEDGTQLEYWVREVGFYLADGTLLAIWSHETQALAYKAAGVDLLLAFDMALAALPAERVTVVGTGGVSLPPATTLKLGLMRFATATEAKAGTLHDKAVTPKGMRAHGDARYSKLSHQHDADYAALSHLHDNRYIQLSDAPRAVYVDVRSTGRTANATTALNWALAIHPNSGFGNNDHLIVLYRNRYARSTGNSSSWWIDDRTTTFIKAGSWRAIATSTKGYWG
jgi:hypothetical protein